MLNTSSSLSHSNSGDHAAIRDECINDKLCMHIEDSKLTVAPALTLYFACGVPDHILRLSFARCLHVRVALVDWRGVGRVRVTATVASNSLIHLK